MRNKRRIKAPNAYVGGREHYKYPQRSTGKKPLAWDKCVTPWDQMQHFIDAYNWVDTFDQDLAFRHYWHGVSIQHYYSGAREKVAMRHTGSKRR